MSPAAPTEPPRLEGLGPLRDPGGPARQRARDAAGGEWWVQRLGDGPLELGDAAGLPSGLALAPDGGICWPAPTGVPLTEWVTSEAWSPDAALAMVETMVGLVARPPRRGGVPMAPDLRPESWRVSGGEVTVHGFRIEPESPSDGDPRLGALVYLVLARRPFGKGGRSEKLHDHHVERRLAAPELSAWGAHRAAVVEWLRPLLAWSWVAQPDPVDAASALRALREAFAAAGGVRGENPSAPPPARPAAGVEATSPARASPPEATASPLEAPDIPAWARLEAGSPPAVPPPAAARPAAPASPVEVTVPEWVRFTHGRRGPPPPRSPAPASAAEASRGPRPEPPPLVPVSLPRPTFADAVEPTEPPTTLFEQPDRPESEDERPGRRRGGLVARGAEVVPFPVTGLPPHAAPRRAPRPAEAEAPPAAPASRTGARGLLVGVAALVVMLTVGLWWAVSRPGSAPPDPSPVVSPPAATAPAPVPSEGAPTAASTPAEPPPAEPAPAEAAPEEPPSAEPAPPEDRRVATAPVGSPAASPPASSAPAPRPPAVDPASDDPWAVTSVAPPPAPTAEDDPWGTGGLSATEPVIVLVTSEPGGLWVEIDGVTRGRAPVRVELQPGAHTLAVVDEDGVHSRTIQVSAGGRTAWAYDGVRNTFE